MVTGTQIGNGAGRLSVNGSEYHLRSAQNVTKKPRCLQQKTRLTIID